MHHHTVSFIFVSLFIFLISLTGCQSTPSIEANILGNNPPPVSIEINDDLYDTILGAYCWGPDDNGDHECTDTAGPEELLSNAEPIKVAPEEDIKIIMHDHDIPPPNKIHFSQIDNNEFKDIKLNNNQFKAPNEKGVYFYEYAVWWMDENDDQLSLGDAFYAFVIEVE